MSESPNIALARRLYDSNADPAVTKEIMAPDIVWDITPGFPFGGIYHGYDSMMNDFFGSLLPGFESFAAKAEEYYATDDDHVFVLGHYHGVSRDGTTADARFIHLWTVRDGKLAHLRQAADSHILQDRLTNDLGADYREGEPFAPHVEVDRTLHTGQNPASAVPLAQELVKSLS